MRKKHPINVFSFSFSLVFFAGLFAPFLIWTNSAQIQETRDLLAILAALLFVSLSVIIGFLDS